MSIPIDKLSDEILRALNEFSDSTAEAVDSAALATAKEARSSLASTSPKMTGAYSKGWAVKVTSRARSGGLGSVTVYNKDEYRLTHLLEKGHTKVVYGHRIGGTVSPRVHIKPVEVEAQEGFIRRLKSEIGK